MRELIAQKGKPQFMAKNIHAETFMYICVARQVWMFYPLTGSRGRNYMLPYFRFCLMKENCGLLTSAVYSDREQLLKRDRAEALPL